MSATNPITAPGASRVVLGSDPGRFICQGHPLESFPGRLYLRRKDLYRNDPITTDGHALTAIVRATVHRALEAVVPVV